MGISVELREKGNEVLLSIKEQMAPCIKEQRLKEAYIHYHKALETSTNDYENCSASKNISTAAYKLFK
jgi:hypothetical protein